MIVFARLTGIMIVVIAAAVVLIRIAAGPPTITFAGWFNNPDGTPCQSPCLFGVQIGVSTPDQIRTIIRKHPLTETLLTYQNTDRQSIESRGDNAIIQFYQDRITQRSGSIFAEFSVLSDLPMTNLPLSAVISVLGPPDIVYLNRDNTFITLVYTNTHLEIGCFRERWRFSPESRCYSVYLDLNPHFAPSPLGARWLGFTTIQRYFAALAQ